MRSATFIKIKAFILAILLMACNESQTGVILFEPNKISTSAVEYAITFSSSGEELFFARSDQQWGKGNMKSSIYYSVKENGTWSTPELAPFSGRYDDSDPHLANNDNTLYFISHRPSEKTRASADIWRAVRDPDGVWGTPVRLTEPLNSDNTEYSPRTDAYGNLFFASNRPGGYGQGDLYVSQRKNGKFLPPENLGKPINSETGEWNLEINDNGDVLIFEASQRKENVSPYGDLYISFKKDNAWSTPMNIQEFNTSGSDLYPHLTHNEETIFFTSSDSLKSTDTNIYYADFTEIIKKYNN